MELLRAPLRSTVSLIAVKTNVFFFCCVFRRLTQLKEDPPINFLGEIPSRLISPRHYVP